MRFKNIKEGVGRITKQNQTVDVGPKEISKQAKKFGNTVDKDGRPPTLSKKVKGKSTNVLFNLGLAESVESKTQNNYKSFIKFCVEQLKPKNPPKIKLTSRELPETFGYFDIDENSITVSYARRHQMDVMRTIAHEIVHHVQRENKEDLAAHLHRLEEAEKRDHRKIGKLQNLFHTQEEAPGMVFWHPKGWTLYQIIMQYMSQVFKDNGYQEVHTPEVMDRTLWEKSGHWDKFGDAMFTTHSENRDYAVKPMNCPGHVQIFNQGLKSYRDLPLRLAEFGSCHRNEPSGTLHGIMRVRNFVQDDAHIFCTVDQIQSEVSAFIDLTFKVYKHFGFENIDIKLSTRPEKRVGSDEVWDQAEAALAQALDAKGINWDLQEGEGAFYGPKVEFVLKDCLDREWQCGTIQADFSMPDRLDAHYIAEDGSKQIPVMLHRVIVGSIERFTGILIEHYEGAFPSWLAPIQAVIINISQKQEEYTKNVEMNLKKQGLRVISDLRNEKIGFKIREHSMQRYPYILVVGDREQENNQVSVRRRGGEDLGSMSLEALTELINQE